MDAMMRKRENKIVVASDKSEESMFALSWCLSNLLKLSSSPQTPQTSDSESERSSSESESDSESITLILLYVKPPPPVYSALDLTGYLFGSDAVVTMEEYSKKLVDSVMSKADAICTKYSCNYLKVEKKVGSGDAKDVICRCVDVTTDVRKAKQKTDINEKITKHTQIYVVHQRCVGYIHGQKISDYISEEETDYKTHKKRSRSKNILSCNL